MQHPFRSLHILVKSDAIDADNGDLKATRCCADPKSNCSCNCLRQLSNNDLKVVLPDIILSRTCMLIVKALMRCTDCHKLWKACYSFKRACPAGSSAAAALYLGELNSFQERSQVPQSLWHSLSRHMQHYICAL